MNLSSNKLAIILMLLYNCIYWILYLYLQTLCCSCVFAVSIFTSLENKQINNKKTPSTKHTLILATMIGAFFPCRV